MTEAELQRRVTYLPVTDPNCKYVNWIVMVDGREVYMTANREDARQRCIFERETLERRTVKSAVDAMKYKQSRRLYSDVRE